MIEKLREAPSTLYEQDETAWLESMAALVAARRWDELDADNLSEYLHDMAHRDRREVHSRLATLLTHLLKWDYQPEGRTNSWLATIKEQRKELHLLLESGTLRNHAAEILGKAYAWAVDQASAETGLPETAFPTECPYTLEQVLAET